MEVKQEVRQPDDVVDRPKVRGNGQLEGDWGNT